MKSWNCKAVLAFARDAGGAAVVAPVVELMRRSGGDVMLLAKDRALEVFSRRRVEHGAMVPLEELERACRARFGRLPDLVYTSAASLPQFDMTEKLLWRWARERGVGAAAGLDQWQNYAARFSGVSPRERLAYLPDVVLVMDEDAREEAVADGLPAERLRVAGQPALEETAALRKTLDRAAARKRLGAAPRDFLVVFAAEAFKAHFDDLGFDEQTTAAFLIETLEAVAPRSRRAVRLAVKLHPQNRRGEFEARAAASKVPASIAGVEVTAPEAIRAADLVVGMTSIFLVQSVLMGVPTLSLQLDAKGPSQLTLTKSGALPFLTDAGKARNLLSKLVLDAAARKAHAARQARWGRSFTGSARRTLAECEKLIIRQAQEASC